MLAFLFLGIIGVIDSNDALGPLLFLQLFGLVTAGYVSGRLSDRDRPLHGGMSGLTLFVITTAITVASKPQSHQLASQDIPIPVVAIGGLIAVILGSVGGALAQLRCK